MLAMDVIEESTSSWSSPVALVKKKNGKVRLCLDARRLNDLTQKEAYPLPLIESLISRLDQTRYITSLDLKCAFWQIPLHPNSRDKTAFTVPGQPLFQFKVMPFGLCNAPQTLCRLMHKVIPHQLQDRVFTYLDDLLITSATLDEHFDLLAQVASLLSAANLSINIEKSHFLLKQIKYLGYLVGDGCLRTDPERIRAIVEFPTPRTQKQIRRFLGMCGWYRRFIRNFSIISASLSDLLKKNSKWKWSDITQSSFTNLKNALSTAPILSHPNFNERFFIQCDACSSGIGGVLFQLDSQGAEKPISYFSQKLNHAQRNYSVTELECFAAVQSIKKFRCYIEGYEFSVITDHASLQWLMGQKDLHGRLARWSLKLQAFNFTIQHVKGSRNIVPDTLSRVFENSIETLQLNPPPPFFQINTNSSHFQDPTYLELRTSLQSKSHLHSNLRVVDNKIYFTNQFGVDSSNSDLPIWKLYIPNPLVLEVIRQAHDPPSSAHLGVNKTLENLQRYFYWPKMLKTVKDYISHCGICKTCKASNQVLRPPMGDQINAVRPWQHLYMDFLGPYPRTKSGNSYIFIVLDAYTRFVLLFPMRSANAALICKTLENDVFHLFSAPESILTDNGQQFLSKTFQTLLQRFGVQHITTSKYSPQANASERTNRTILSAIRSYIAEDHREWDNHISAIAAAIRNSIHASTGYSSHYLVFGHHKINIGSEYKLLRDLNCLHDYPVAIQQIYVRNFVQSEAARHFSAKLARKFIMGYVKELIGNVVVEVVDEKGNTMGT